MFSLIWTFFSDLLYWIALLSILTGACLYLVSYLVKFLPMLKPQALMMQVGGIVLVILGGAYVTDHHGYQRRVAEDQVEIDRLNGEARAKEVELNKKLSGVTSALVKARNDVKDKQSSINFRVDSGELRIPSSCPIQASADAPPGDTANASQSDRQAIKDIVAIATDGDIAITQLNACIDTYNKVREAVNVKP